MCRNRMGNGKVIASICWGRQASNRNDRFRLPKFSSNVHSTLARKKIGLVN